MLLRPLLCVALVVSPTLVAAALFPADTQVKMIDGKGFRKAMKQNATSVVAFVAPWCGHCQRMAPEYSKASEALSPMVPLYAVDCDQDSNKRLCSEQGVQGFPTIKLYPRGEKGRPISYDSGQRTANNFSIGPPATYHMELDNIEDVSAWVDQNESRSRALLLSSGKDIPLMWKALGNKYKDNVAFGVLQDMSGKTAVKMGVEEKATKASKVLIYPSGSSDYVRFEGRKKFNPLDKYLKTVADGTVSFLKAKKEEEREADLKTVTRDDQVVFNATEASVIPEVEEISRSGSTTVSRASSPALPSETFREILVESEGVDSEMVTEEVRVEPSFSSAETDGRGQGGEGTNHAKDEL